MQLYDLCFQSWKLGSGPRRGPRNGQGPHGWLCVLAKQGTPSLAPPRQGCRRLPPPPQACGLCSPPSWLSHSPGLLCFQTPRIWGGWTGRQGWGRVCPCPRSALSMGGGLTSSSVTWDVTPSPDYWEESLGCRMGRGCSQCPAHSRRAGHTVGTQGAQAPDTWGATCPSHVLRAACGALSLLSPQTRLLLDSRSLLTVSAWGTKGSRQGTRPTRSLRALSGKQLPWHQELRRGISAPQRKGLESGRLGHLGVPHAPGGGASTASGDSTPQCHEVPPRGQGPLASRSQASENGVFRSLVRGAVRPWANISGSLGLSILSGELASVGCVPYRGARGSREATLSGAGDRPAPAEARTGFPAILTAAAGVAGVVPGKECGREA